MVQAVLTLFLLTNLRNAYEKKTSTYFMKDELSE